MHDLARRDLLRTADAVGGFASVGLPALTAQNASTAPRIIPTPDGLMSAKLPLMGKTA